MILKMNKINLSTDNLEKIKTHIDSCAKEINFNCDRNCSEITCAIAALEAAKWWLNEYEKSVKNENQAC